MKKTILFIIILLICLSNISPCMAATILEPGKSGKHPVYGVVSSKDGDVYRIAVSNFRAKVTTNDGTVIEVSGAPKGAQALVVKKITSKDSAAWDWFNACMKNASDKFIPYDIYFEDKNGVRISFAKTTAVKVSIAESFENPVAYRLSDKGKLKKIDVKNNFVSFSPLIDGTEYLVLANTEAFKAISPQTGEKNIVNTIYILLFASGAFIITSRIFLKRKKHRALFH